ncbi:MAG: RluA family pseudouridine synthase [Candidatus Marinimicrobia bacterium]|nr:RluA family pseudouridine synthase [Candidatus Neomarinimicrobiota bacterium]
MKNDILIVDKSGIRLDKFLADNISEFSRSQLQKYIKNGNITINEEIKPVKYRLNLGDKIHIEISEKISDNDFVEPQDIPIDIIFEDDDIIVINKEAGMTVHPGTGNRDGTLANALAFHCAQLSDINGPVRPGIVHRLDKDTSGIIIAAKTNYAHIKIAEQFANRLVKKVYYGITWGNWKKEEGLIDQPIARKRNDPTSFIVNITGKKAQTNFQVIKKSQYFSHVNFFPKTGRTHQIRVHSSFVGNPIIGDIKYGGGLSRIKGYIPEISKKLESFFKIVQRHILHAQKISFIHPRNEKKMNFESDLPDDIKNIFNTIDTLNV